MEYRKQSHAVYYAVYHIVISTKYRRKVLKSGMEEYLKRKVPQVSKFHPEIEILEINTDVDHIHLMMSIPPKIPVSNVVKAIKSNTGTAMRKRFPFLDKVYWGVRGIWSIGYFVSTVGVDEKIIRNTLRCKAKKTADKRSLNYKMLRV